MELFDKTLISSRLYIAWGTTNGKINGVITFLTQLASGMTYLVIGIIAMQGTIGIGEVMLYANAILRFTTSLVTLAASYNNIAYRYEYLNSYEAFIQRPNMSYEGTLPVEKRDDGEYHLTFDHVSYRYPGQSENALKDISFDLETEETLCGRRAQRRRENDVHQADVPAGGTDRGKNPAESGLISGNTRLKNTFRSSPSFSRISS